MYRCLTFGGNMRAYDQKKYLNFGSVTSLWTTLSVCQKKKETWPLKKCEFHVRVQATITGFQTFYWSNRTASPPQLIQ